MEMKGAGHPNQGYQPPGAQGYPPSDYSDYQAPTTHAPHGYGQPQPSLQGQLTGQNIANMMPAPISNPNCPPGLEYLTQIDQVLIHQQVEMLEVWLGYEQNNKFEIKNSLGQRIYFAAEQNDCCTRNFLGSARPFVMTILDNTGREIMRITRPCRCESCFCPCFLQKLEVQAPPGTPIGYVIQNWHPILPKFTIQNERGESVLKIVGPCVPCRCCADVNFEVKSLDEQSVVGKISKQWSGAAKEFFSDADNFGIQFPMDLDVKMKAVMMGACFLIDFMYFEKNN
ncbi:phospholipid scramblase 1-like [Discoglossus pictus]